MKGPYRYELQGPFGWVLLRRTFAAPGGDRSGDTSDRLLIDSGPGRHVTWLPPRPRLTAGVHWLAVWTLVSELPRLPLRECVGEFYAVRTRRGKGNERSIFTFLRFRR